MKKYETQTQWEERMAEKILQLTRTELLEELCYFKFALFALKDKPYEGLGSLATDGVFLSYSPAWTLRVFEKNPQFLNRVYLHSVMHCLFRHPWLRGKRERRRWNLACDIVVEHTIDALNKKTTRRIIGWQRQKMYDKLESLNTGISAAVVYRLPELQDEKEFALLEKEFYTDDHSFWPEEEKLSPAAQETKKQWDKLSRQTSLEQKRSGEEEGEGEQLLAKRLRAEKSRRSYAEFLRKFSVLREELHCDPDEFDPGYYTYGLKLYGNMPLIDPLESREQYKIREFVVVLDTSYSTNGELIKNFLRETYTLLSEQDSFFQKSRIRILQCDSQVREDREIKSQEELERLLYDFTIVGGGTTDFRPAFVHVEKLLEQGELKNLGGLMYFTDGKGIYPKKKPSYRTAFLFLEDYEEDAVPPWAMRLRLEEEESYEYQRSKTGNYSYGTGVSE